MKSRDYLCIDPFIADMVGARALSTAFETGVIDQLLQHGADTETGLQAALGHDPRGLHLLLGMLRANRVLEPGESVQLTAAFRTALDFRDLLEAKLHFAHLVAPDFLHLLTALLLEPRAFVEQARIFKLFSYQRAFEPTPDNYAQTARWMRITTALTKYEAQACIDAHDFSQARRMLDVGGNSGEFALRVCRAHPALQAAVYDLPLVCDIGAGHVADQPEAGRIAFIKRDPAQPALPGGYDLITFKSMLHDWPDADMADFLRRAHAALEPAGKVLVFERGEVEVGAAQLAYGQLPLALFFRSYRTPRAYLQQLEALGFHSVTVAHIMLDMPFILITATK